MASSRTLSSVWRYLRCTKDLHHTPTHWPQKYQSGFGKEHDEAYV